MPIPIDDMLNQEEQRFILDVRITALDKALYIHQVGYQGSEGVNVEKIIETAQKIEAYLQYGRKKEVTP